ncbi:hypothetical protein IFR05_012396 [Cadophora sp. M221]|nr:hypothetical protein IFR05_012396 [Cadophora sp. M221]
MVLSFVNYHAGDENQNAESRRIVKSHVSRAWHRDKRLGETMRHARLQLHARNEVELPPPSVALPYLEGLIPYSYFAGGGPVLYLKPSKWPFHRPFSMAGASSTETFSQSVFPRQSIWMPDADIPDKVAMKGPLLGGDVLSWISHTPECFKYRGDTIGWIQQQLKSPMVSTSDATIGGVMTLTMWENGDGSFLDLSNHMDGLETIVKLKGGISKIQQQKMFAKLVMFDYIIAISCAKQPRFPYTPPPQPHSSASEPFRDGMFAGSPLYGIGNFSQIECNWRREDTEHTLQAMWDLTTHALEPKLPAHLHKGKLRRFRTLVSNPNLEPIPRTISIRQQSAKNAEEMQVFETLHHTALIYERAVTPPHIPFNSPINHHDLAFLYESLNISAPNPFWIRYPGILLWVLLVGCAVSVKREERSYFMMFLAKVGIFTEQRWWFETQNAVLKFIEVQSLTETSQTTTG